MGRKKPQPLPPDDTNSKITEFTREQSWLKRVGWKIATVYAAAFIGLITWYLPKELTQLRETIKGDTAVTIQPLDRRLSTVEGQLRTLIDFQEQIALKDIAKQDRRSFPKSLPVLRKLTGNPPSGQFKPDPATLGEIAAKLRNTSETAPDYWPTVLQFIQFASAGTAPPGVPPRNAPALVRIAPEATGAQLELEGQVVILDGGSIKNSTLVRCRIRFTEKPVGMSNVRFIDCVFEMPVVTTPNEYLKQASKMLLASNLRSVSIPNL